MSDNEKSLSDEATFAGGIQPDSKDLQSLGDRSTLGGGDGSSISDLGSIGDLPDHDMEIVDLSKRYRIEKSLGKGGMGEVLLATDTRLDRQVAIKRIRADIAVGKTAAARFLTEAKAVASLNHNNIVGVYDYGRDDSGPFLIMEYVSGGSLLQRCKEGPIELEQAVDLACQLCDGLGRAHDAGIIHRDIKPANILLTDDGIPKLTDFGLAKADSRDHTMTIAGAVLGTLDFMPPEQRQDAALTDSRSDLWSLSATLYQMVTGEPPRVIDLDLVPQRLRATLSLALKTKKEERYPTAVDLRDALKASLQSDDGNISDVGEGECPHCKTLNDPRRRFCRKCAETLLSPCLSCQADMAIWDDICGDCGISQNSLLRENRDKLERLKLEAIRQAENYDFEKAANAAERIALVAGLRFHDLKIWAEAFRAECADENTRAIAHAVSSLREALTHEQVNDYPSAIRILELVPPAFREIELPACNETVGFTLSRIRSKHEVSERLEKQIRDRIKAHDLNGLITQVDELHQLLPNREDISRLLTQLTERHNKLLEVREACYEDAVRCMESQNYGKCLIALSRVEAEVENEEVRNLRLEAEEKKLRSEELYKYIRACLEARYFDEMLPYVDECLALNQEDRELAKVRGELIARSATHSERENAVAAMATTVTESATTEPAILPPPTIRLAAKPSDVRQAKRAATAGSRLTAMCLDWLFGLLLIAISFFAANIVELREDDSSSGLFMVIPLLGLISPIVINSLMIAVSGQTVGKKALGLKIVDKNSGRTVGFRQGAVLRNLIYLSWLIPVLGQILTIADFAMLFSDDRVTLHDRIANTLVINV